MIVGQRLSALVERPSAAGMKRLAIYCGSATPADPLYIETARAKSAGRSPSAGSASSMAAAGWG